MPDTYGYSVDEGEREKLNAIFDSECNLLIPLELWFRNAEKNRPGNQEGRFAR